MAPVSTTLAPAGVLGNYERYQLMGAMSGPTIIPGVNFRIAAAWEFFQVRLRPADQI